jgi:phosphohistidine phosphatase
MRLMLFRHAKSKRPPGLADHNRPLSGRGRRASKQMGMHMARKGLVPDQAIASTASRTQETWYLARLGFESDIICRSESRAYDASPDTLLKVIRETSEKVRNLVVVGHNPGLWHLALSLIDEAETRELDRLKSKLPPAGLVVIDFKSGSWEEVSAHTGKLKRFATPNSIGR